MSHLPSHFYSDVVTQVVVPGNYTARTLETSSVGATPALFIDTGGGSQCVLLTVADDCFVTFNTGNNAATPASVLVSLPTNAIRLGVKAFVPIKIIASKNSEKITSIRVTTSHAGTLTAVTFLDPNF